MNAYSTTGQVRIQPGDVSAIRPTNRFMGGGSLAALERERGWQAETEMAWLIQQNAVKPQASASRVVLLRQTIGTALLRAGVRLAGTPRTSAAPDTSPVTGMLGTASRPA